MRSLLRVLKYGWQEFSRNMGISLGNVFILFLAFFLVGVAFLSNGLSENFIKKLQEKVDITVFFKDEAKEKDILVLERKLKSLKEVKEVRYISKEEALKKFKKKYERNSLLMSALKEIGENPFPASLTIKAKSPEYYEKISLFIEKSFPLKLIEKITYKEHKDIISRIISFSKIFQKTVLIASLILIIIALLVTLNTIRLSIFAKKEELEIMKLIGGSNFFARGPFIIQGIIVGALGGTLAFLLFFLFAFFASPNTLSWWQELEVIDLINKNLVPLLLIEIGGGAFFGFFSAFVATERYLKI